MSKILIVDDDLSLRGLLALTLESAGYATFEAASADDAIASFKQQTFSVVILDMGMPPHEHSPEEGLRVLDWISQSGIVVKVIVLTGQEANSASYLAIKHGAFDFLEKPISESMLVSAVERAELFMKQAEKLKEQEGVQKVELDLLMGEGVKNARNAAELKLVKQVLVDTNFNVHEVARRLGLKRENVYYLINKYGIERDSS